MASFEEAAQTSTERCLEFRHVTFGYESEPVLTDIDFSVGRGEFVAILGPNGSGKTTLVKLALGLVKPTGGSVLLFGERPERFRDWGRVGFVPQTTEGMDGFSPLTVEEVVAQGVYAGFDPLAVFRRRGRDAVLRAMDTANVAGLRKRRLSSLSSGQQQRALVARALVRAPDLLVFDEPVAAVDAAGQEQFYSLLRRLNNERGITIVMVSHDVGVVLRQASTVACINRTLMFHGPPHRINREQLAELYGVEMDVLLHDVIHEHR